MANHTRTNYAREIERPHSENAASRTTSDPSTNITDRDDRHPTLANAPTKTKRARQVPMGTALSQLLRPQRGMSVIRL
jgi:hypothetical protein